MVFESAVYTDVTSDESVDRLDGFGFQAVSEGIDGADRAVIVSELLHVKSRSWPFDREETEHPPTAVYLRGEQGFYFSRGIATGKTNSGRSGNQLTQTVVTREEDDIHPYRPAQIWAARNWRLEKAPSSRSEKWFAPLEIDEAFEGEALIAMLREDPWAAATLPLYLSMLHAALDEPGTKVIVIHHDLELVLKWFAAGTLLLPPNDALALGCRAFATDPFRTTAQLVGVHPDLVTESFSGAHVIDLTRHSASEVPITPEAARIAAWVNDHDAFDAIEAAALGGRWMKATNAEVGGNGVEMVLGLRTVEAGRDEWEIGISLIEGLGEAGLRDDLELYFDELSDSIASYGVRSTDDAIRAARAARYAADTGVAGLAEAVLVPSLEALAADPTAASAWASELNASGGWQTIRLSEPERIADLFAELILGTTSHALPQLLRLAAPLSDNLPTQRLSPAIERAVSYLLDHPREVSNNITSWYDGERIVRHLRRSLLGELADRTLSHARLARELGDGAWDAIIDDGSPDSHTRALAQWREAARIGLQVPDNREEAIENSLKNAASDPSRARLQPAGWILAIGPEDDTEQVDPRLLALWVRRVGLNDSLREECSWLLAPVLQRHPKMTKTRDIKGWIELAKALITADPGNHDHLEAEARLTEILRGIPSAKNFAKDGFSSAVGFLTGRRHNDASDERERDE